MKKLLLLALTCTIPSFMFGQVTKYEKGLEAAGKAATKTGAVITEGITVGTTKTLTGAAINTTPIEVATANGPIYTGMNVGTNAYMQTAATAPVAQLPNSTQLKHKIANLTKQVAFRFDIFQNRIMGGEDLDTFYLKRLVNRFRDNKVALNSTQKANANAFYTGLLDPEKAFVDPFHFSKALAAVTGLAYTGSEEIGTILGRFAVNAPKEYTFLTDFVVIPVLRMHDPESVKALARYRSIQEEWMEGGQGETLSLYQTLQQYDKTLNDFLPENLRLDNIPEENRKVAVPQKPWDYYLLMMGDENNVLYKMRLYMSKLSKNQGSDLFGWGVNYRQLFFEKQKSER